MKEKVKNHNYLVTTKDSNQQLNLWSSPAETLIALLALELERCRGLNPIVTVRDLNFVYLRKRKSVNSNRNYSATALQRCILNKTGY